MPRLRVILSSSFVFIGIYVQQMKNVYNTEKQMIKLGLLNIRSLSMKASFVNDMITDYKLDVLSLIET